MTIQDLREEVYEAMKDKPKEWRNGQFVFNYIDAVYGVAREVQFRDGIDCFYDDDKIYPSWLGVGKRLKEGDDYLRHLLCNTNETKEEDKEV